MVKKQKNISNCNKVKGKKWGLKILSFGLLGVMLASTGLFGLGHTTTQAQTAQGGSTLADGGAIDNSFNLHPETDPVIYTTESGLKIKFGGATLSSSQSSSLQGYTYFEMGTYNSSPILWAIIGRSSQGFETQGKTSLLSYFSNLSTSTAISNWINNYFETETPYGNAIWNDDTMGNSIIAGQRLELSSLETTSDIIDKELDSGEVLCFAVTNITTSAFDSTRQNNYNNDSCNLRILMSSYCNNDNGEFSSTIGFSELEMRLIRPQTLITAHYGGQIETPNSYLFPLGAIAMSDAQSFCIENYLSTNTLRNIGSAYWLRTGTGNSQCSYYVWSSGEVGASWGKYANNGLGVRPAFVIKLA